MPGSSSHVARLALAAATLAWTGGAMSCGDEPCAASECAPDAGNVDGGPGADAGGSDVDAGGIRLDSGVSTDSGAGLPDASPYDSGTLPGNVGVVPGEVGRTLVRGRAVLTMAPSNVLAPGEVYIVNGRIACVGAKDACLGQATGASVVDTDGVILPGLIDAHNHVPYNWLGEWEPGHLWSDHTHWQGSSEYDTYLAVYDQNKSVSDNFCAMLQWGELRSLANGTTTVLGVPQARTCIRWLVRNGELSSAYSGWAADRMRTNTLGVGTLDSASAASLISQMDAGNVTAYMIHLAEGVSARARNEYLTLLGFELVRSETVIIHGTALTEADFAEVANAGAKLVWSPSSNMVLYGETTNIEAAVGAGIAVSIAPDWTLSGADDVLHEVRFAKGLVESRWPSLFADRDYLEMVTRIPAEQMAVSTDVGTLEVGKLGDLLVLDIDDAAPYAAAVAARPQDIRLVMIAGIPSYGDPRLMGPVPGTPVDCFDMTACGSVKRGCWEAPPTGQVSPGGVAAVIRGFAGAEPLGLFTCD